MTGPRTLPPEVTTTATDDVAYQIVREQQKVQSIDLTVLTAASAVTYAPVIYAPATSDPEIGSQPDTDPDVLPDRETEP